jgi:hypothetical protein
VYERKKEVRIAKAKARRREALARSAPKALNPYASDESAEESEGPASSGAEEAGGEEELDDEAWAKAVQSGKISKGERLVPLDHSTIKYPAFRKARVSFSAFVLKPELFVRLSYFLDVAHLNILIGSFRLMRAIRATRGKGLNPWPLAMRAAAD